MSKDVKLNPAEEKVKKEYIDSLSMQERKTTNHVVIAMVGAVGSGKSFVANKIAERIGATVISGDEIRVLLRSEDEDWKSLDTIREEVIAHCVRNDHNVIIDSDVAAESHRERVRDLTKDLPLHVYYVRTLASPEAIINRARSADYSTSVSGKLFAQRAEDLGVDIATIKISEFHRRTPLHFDYKWKGDATGTWELKEMSFVDWEVDTEKTKSEMSEILDKIADEIKN